MAFYGSHFSFDGTPCEEFGLTIYDISGNTQGNSGMIASTGEIVEDWIPSKDESYFYGIKKNKPLSFNMTFGVDMDCGIYSAFPSQDEFLDRWQIAEIANWLTGHNTGFKCLEIEQPDMETVRFYCVISDLKIVTVGWFPWAFTCTVTCNSPYAYMYPLEYTYSCTGRMTETLFSKSMINDPYYPIVYIKNCASNEISIINKSDNSRELKLNGIPINAGDITIDNKRGIITASSGLNLYDGFNFKFFRLLPGYNELVISGNMNLSICCEFPMNFGG